MKKPVKKPSPTKLKPGAVRIITGAWRGRGIEVPPGQLIRPTADRVREALFNRLAHAFTDSGFQLTGARIVDVFAGTGALGLEALSRGAAHCTFIDRNPDAVALLKRNVAKLGAEDRAVVMNADGAHLPRAATVCDLALLDPPYGEGLVTPALQGLGRQGWLKPGALVAAETDAGDPEPAAENFTLVDRRAYGRVAVSFLSYRT
ncbi:MAG: 16S rRNA (guanine(966)-N(2))-methyltransferase RsmD [Rhodospirillaceae bacterium]|nr:16S rRNA (guanine(966)-N(2))-methyltransferase RsmD [Rhodospirillaceae bacterium]